MFQPAPLKQRDALLQSPPPKKNLLILTKEIDVLIMTVVQHYSGIVVDVMVDNGEL